MEIRFRQVLTSFSCRLRPVSTVRRRDCIVCCDRGPLVLALVSRFVVGLVRVTTRATLLCIALHRCRVVVIGLPFNSFLCIRGYRLLGRFLFP